MSPATVRKQAPAAAVAAELAGLRWLAAVEADGGARVVRVAAAGEGWLETLRVPETSPDAAAAEDFGRRLARTHAAGAPAFGSAPPGIGADAFMGAAPLVLHPDPASARPTWGEFYAVERVLPYLAGALANGSIDADGARAVERCAARVAAGTFDAPQPALVRTRAARLHGDLWSGNVLWTRAGGDGTHGLSGDDDHGRPGGDARPGAGAVEAVLIDPAAQGGHAESDLAQLGVFGAPHEARIRAAYDEASLLADGWQERIELHQLHLLLVHADLFGGGYGVRSVAVARRYA